MKNCIFEFCSNYQLYNCLRYIDEGLLWIFSNNINLNKCTKHCLFVFCQVLRCRLEFDSLWNTSYTRRNTMVPYTRQYVECPMKLQIFIMPCDQPLVLETSAGYSISLDASLPYWQNEDIVIRYLEVLGIFTTFGHSPNNRWCA